MAIPSMLEIIKTFNACSPAQDWAGNMDVQEGWDDCKEPGWLMLLAFSTQKYPHAVGFSAAVECTYRCIEHELVLLKDDKMREIAAHARAFGQNPDEAEKAVLKTNKEYVAQRIDSLTKAIRYATKKTQNMGLLLASEYMATCSINQFLFSLLRSQDIVISGKLANAAIDSSVTAAVAVIYPDLMNVTFQLPEVTPVSVIKEAEAAKKIEICGLLRSIMPSPFLKFE